MTRNQLLLFCLSLISAFVLLYSAVNSQHTSAKSESNEEEIRDAIDKIERLETELEELNSKFEQLELELIDLRE